jgi:hypothetical protein
MSEHEKHFHGASTEQSVHERVGNAHHSRGAVGFGHNPKNRAINHAHHSTGARGFMSESGESTIEGSADHGASLLGGKSGVSTEE